MGGIGIEGGASGNLVEVTPDKEMQVRSTLNVAKAGFVALCAETDPGNITGNRIIRPIKSSPEGRLRVGLESLLFEHSFQYATQFNSNNFQVQVATMTVVQAQPFLVLNSANSIVASVYARVFSCKSFPFFCGDTTYMEMLIAFAAAAPMNVISEWGAFHCAAATTPTDGVFFRANGTAFTGVVCFNGVETSVNLGVLPSAGVRHRYSLSVDIDFVQFAVDGVILGIVPNNMNAGGMTMSASLPFQARVRNGASAPTVAQQLKIGWVQVTLGDLSTSRLWATTMVGCGNGCYQTPAGVVSGQNTQWTNSTAPTLVALTNTTAAYATLGGLFQYSAMAGSETDYILFGYQVPLMAAGVPAKSLIIRGVQIDTTVLAVPVSAAPTVLQWGIAVGSTAVSLATAEAQATKAPRRVPLGMQTFLVGAAVGTNPPAVNCNLDSPLMANPGEFVHIILRVIAGSVAVAGQIYRGSVMINGYFE